MNILSIGNFSGTGWDGSITDENHIADALEELGHGVTRVQRDSFDAINTESSIDFVLIAQWDGYPNLSTISTPIVYWAFDYQADGQEWHERLIAASDLYLSKRIEDKKFPNWQWLSQDFAPNFLRRHKEKVVKDIDILFTGSYLDWADERNRTLKAIDEKFNLVIHSTNTWPTEFKNTRNPIMDEGLPELYARAKVILSIDHTTERGYWSDRNAQIMCCGRRPLFRYVPMSEATFHDHVDYFYNIEDCLEKIQYRLDNPISELDSYRFAKNNLRVNNRVKDLLVIVNETLHVR